MEWIRISENKLKIMLTAEDARHYELNCEQADYADVQTRTAFREILTDVGRETDFEAIEDKVYIQMYPSKEGGCELFVTKTGLLLNEQEPPKMQTGKKEHTRSQRVRRESIQAFRFQSFPLLLAACRRLQGLHSIRKSDALRDTRGTWWLLLFSYDESPKLRFLSTYAREVRADLAQIYLAEYGKTVFEKEAIARLAALS